MYRLWIYRNGEIIMTNLYKYKNGIEIEIQEKSTILRVNGNEIKYKNSKDAFDFAKTYKSILNINKKYNIIYVDPPWSYSDKKCNGNALSHYNTMNITEICNLDISSISENDCVLFMWVTYPMLKEGLQLIESWGFKYKTIGFQWVKLNKKNLKPFFGLGRWTRGNTECCLIATKGKPKRVSSSIFQLIQTPIEGHSKKPDIVREKIVELMGDLPRIELFARIKKEGWDVWGNETDKFN